MCIYSSCPLLSRENYSTHHIYMHRFSVNKKRYYKRDKLLTDKKRNEKKEIYSTAGSRFLIRRVAVAIIKKKATLRIWRTAWNKNDSITQRISYLPPRYTDSFSPIVMESKHFFETSLFRTFYMLFQISKHLRNINFNNHQWSAPSYCGKSFRTF